MEKSKSAISEKLDDCGNAVFAVRKENIITLFLKLKSETRKRKIGFINTNTKTLHVNRVRQKHLFRKLDAYGFCYQIIHDAKLFNNIRIKDDFCEWLLPTSFILNRENSSFLNFKGKGGFELQVFVSLKQLEQFKREPKF